MTQRIQPIRGIKDLITDELMSYKEIIEISSELVKLYGYNEILLPIIEYSSVFLRTLGESSDIVNKETYTFSDRDKRTITLRPEFTAAMVRAVISNGLTQTMPQRFFTYGPLFRHERPQQGRNRQFNQFDCELFGISSPLADVEIIHILNEILKKLNLNYEIEINTLGDTESSENYNKALIKYLTQYQSKLSKISQERLQKNPLRVLDSKEEEDIEIVKNAPIIFDYINQASLDHYSAVCDGLSSLNIHYIQNPRLVRGLDYYTHTVFEVSTSKLGSQKAIAAGGRYDHLVENMGNGQSVPAVGFALGIDRVQLLTSFQEKKQNICYLIPIGDNAELHAINLANELRNKGIAVRIDYALSTKKRLKIANRDNMNICVIFGEDEIKNNEYILRHMSKSKEEKVHIEEIDEIILQYLNE